MSDLIIEKMVSDYFQALAHPIRIEIIELLKEKEQMCVCEIVDRLKKDQSNISRHLDALKRVGIVDCNSKGARSIYTIKNKDVDKILNLVKSFIRKEVKEGQKVLQVIWEGVR